jgi:hypothetical protein
MLPAPTGKIPISDLNRVVFPIPFRPMIATISLGAA